MTVRELRRRWKPTKQRVKDSEQHQPLLIRIHRACSWLQAVENLEPQQLDERLIFQWIALKAYRLDWAATAELPDQEPLTLTASSGFFVERVDPELRSPTANLGLLRRAAEQTADVGGRYVDLQGLGGLLGDLTRNDPRESVTRRTQRVATEAYAWWLWAAVVALLGTEWVLRKRAGLP